MSLYSPEHDPPGDTGPPHTNNLASIPANFTTMLELFRDVLSSQVTFVSQHEFEQLCQLVPSQPEGVPQEAIINAARIAIPFLDIDLLNSSIAIMENMGKHTDLSTLPVAAVPPEIWAALRAAIPSQGSHISSAVTSSPAFSKARATVSGDSSPMDDSPTGMPLPPIFLEASTLQDTPLNNEANPIWVSSGDENPQANRQAFNDCMCSFSVDHTPGTYSVTPNHTISPHADSRAVSTRAMIASQNGQDNFLDTLMSSNTLIANAEITVQQTLEELNKGVEGYSHYFLRESLTLCDEPAIEVASPHLQHILDITGTALSMGPCNKQDSDFPMRMCMHTQSSMHGQFPSPPPTRFIHLGNNLPELETQTDTLKAMAMQIIENLQLDNGLIMPQDSIDGIHSTVWHVHEAHIRAIVKHEALKVEHRLSTMGLLDLIDKLECNAPMEEITDTLCDNIMEQIHSKYNNELLVAKLKAYKQAIKEAEQARHAEATASIKPYENNLMEKAKDQACLKADSEFSHLLADK
ncbi:hypothetical protein V8E53_011720 [Lactarius tabidus]